MNVSKYRALELDTGNEVFGYYYAENGYHMSKGEPVFDKPCVRHKIVDEIGCHREIAPDTLEETVKYTKEDLNGYWPAKCPSCGWRGLSKDCTGGDAIADTGDFNEVTCPKCTKEMEDACKKCGEDGVSCEVKKCAPCSAFGSPEVDGDENYEQID